MIGEKINSITYLRYFEGRNRVRLMGLLMNLHLEFWTK